MTYPAANMGSMKRLLWSVGISVALLVAYLGISAVVVVALSPDPDHYDPKVVKMVQFPVQIPTSAYYYFFPPTADDFSQQLNMKKAAIATAIFVVNVVLYAIPVYVILSIAGRFQKKRITPSAIPPSPPPSF
jgi:hypothetical protein